MHPSDHDLLLAKRLDRLDLSTRAANCLRQARVRTIGQLVALRRTDILKWPNAGKRTLLEIRTLLGSLGLCLVDDKGSPIIDVQRPAPPIVAAPVVLEEELYRFAGAFSTERNADILMRLWGWNGQAPKTLDAVGKEFGLTRERVRQIEKRALPRLRERGFEAPLDFEAPLLDVAIKTLRSMVPEVESSLGVALQERGISRNEFSPKSVQSAAEHLGVKWPFEFVDIGARQVLTLAGEGETCRKAISLVRKKTSERGCLSILSLASELQMEEKDLPGLRRVLDVGSKIEWLDESQEWLYGSESPRNRLFNLCSKVLGVASRLHLSELRRAVSKSRRLAMCPPQRILGAFIERCGLGRVEDSIVIANPGSGIAPTEDSNEGLMLRVLSEHGPAMDGEVFAEECIAAGMNATTFYIYRMISPVVCSLGRSVYCKVGTNVPAGTVESIAGRRRAIAKSSNNYGWTSTGRLWFGVELTRQVITAGGLRVPAFVLEFVQGDWQVVLPDGSEYGALKCSDQFIWSVRKPLAILGAEPTDLAALEFDLKTRKVLVTVGGPGLFEAIQESDSAILDEGPEEA